MLLAQTFSNQLHTATFVEEGPTVGLNVKVVKKGGVTMKVVSARCASVLRVWLMLAVS